MRPRGAFVVADSLPVTSVRIATITRKKLTSLPNLKRFCDYFLLNIQCTYRRTSLARRDVFIEALLSVMYHLFRFELVPPTSVVLNRSKDTQSCHNIINGVKYVSIQCYCIFFCEAITIGIKCQICSVELRNNRITVTSVYY